MGKTNLEGVAVNSRQENSEERFRRLATARTNEVLKKLRILGNCANRQVYGYTEKDVEKIFATIERQVKQVRSKFHFPKKERFKL
jgi:hypothetical protein